MTLNFREKHRDKETKIKSSSKTNALEPDVQYIMCERVCICEAQRKRIIFEIPDSGTT